MIDRTAAIGRLQSFEMMLARGRASKDGELEETTLSRLEVWEVSNLGKSTLSEVRINACFSPHRRASTQGPLSAATRTLRQRAASRCYLLNAVCLPEFGRASIVARDRDAYSLATVWA